MSGPSAGTPPLATARAHRLVYGSLALVALLLAWLLMWHISSDDPWYRNADMNIHNVADALSLNSGYPLGIVDQPATTTKLLLAFDFRLRNAVGAQPVWTLKRFARSPDPIAELAELVRIGRAHSRTLVVLFTLFAAGFVGQITRRFEIACLAVVLLSGCSGLLFHGLLLRPELLCTIFGVMAMHCGWLATRTDRSRGRTLWLVLAGACSGLAILSKLPGLIYLFLVFGWCAVAPLLASREARKPSGPPPFGAGVSMILPAIALAVFASLLSLAASGADLHPTAALRLRLLAGLTALLPLLLFVRSPFRFTTYLVDRTLEFAFLLGGLLGACVGWFALLHATLPPPAAASYAAKVLNVVFFPDPLAQLYTQSGSVHRLRELLRFFAESPVLLVATTVFVVALFCFRRADLRLRVFALFFFAQSLGMMWLMSKRQYFNQYSIFVEVPLALTWCFGLAALQEWWQHRSEASERRWPAALVLTAAFILILTMPLKLIPKYRSNQDDAALPVPDLTITFLYDHDVHPAAYLAAMKARYPSRPDFVQALNRFLADPSNRR
ncbi:MAG: phospholipid carrier-dependent glycosyltransferase [Opitutae bacterium]|nr:phospholipid carrier-dependent glycosyltransferase [Opitutae bacterium]